MRKAQYISFFKNKISPKWRKNTKWYNQIWKSQISTNWLYSWRSWRFNTIM